MMKKLVALCIAMMMMLGVLSGCSKPPANESTASSGTTTTIASIASTTANEPKTLEITWMGMNYQGQLPKDGSIIQKGLEEKYNIKIKNVPVDIYNIEQLDLMLATGVEFDVWTFTNKTVAQAIDTGLIRPIPDGYVEKYADGIAKILDSAFSKWKNMSTVDGKLYSIPLYSYPAICPVGLTVRTDWLKNLGVTTMPKTLDELEALLVRFREDDPDKNGQKDTYALGKWWNGNNFMFTAAYVFAAYGVSVERWNVNKDGMPAHWATMDEYKQGLARMRDWYAKGIFHPEVITDDRVATTEKMVTNKIGGVFATDWFAVGNNGNPATPWGGLAKAHPEMDPATISTLIPPVTGPKGNAVTIRYNTPLSKNSTFFFGKNATDEKMIRLLTLFNDTIKDKKQFAQSWFGIEGEHFEFDADGFVVQNKDWTPAEKLTELGATRYTLDHGFIPDDYLKFSFPKYRYNSFMNLFKFDVLPLHMAQAFSTDAEREYSAALNTIQEEFFWQVVTGKIDIEKEWNAYVAKWLAAGGQKVIDAKKAIAVEFGLN